MNRTRSVLARGVVLAVVITVLVLPSTVAAAPTGRTLLAQNTVLVDQPVQPTFAIPGIFALSLGQGFSMQGNEFKLDSAQVDLPVINAVASVDGLSFALDRGLTGWNTITVSQNQPAGSDALLISGGQANLHGPSSGYSAEASANIAVHPSDALQMEATLVAGYDGLARQVGLAVQDASASVKAGPVSFDVNGINAGAGTLTIDTVQAAIPATGTSIVMDGYKMENGLSDWKTVTVSQNELKLGNLASIGDIMITLPGPTTAWNTPAEASMHFQVNAGNIATVQGQLVASRNGATNQTSFALQDGNVAFAVPGWSLTFDGVASAEQGVTVDSVTMQSQTANLEAQLSGVTFGGGGGFTFDQADVKYLPVATEGGSAVAGFEMKITKSDAGYLINTTTVVPVASSR